MDKETFKSATKAAVKLAGIVITAIAAVGTITSTTAHITTDKADADTINNTNKFGKKGSDKK